MIRKIKRILKIAGIICILYLTLAFMINFSFYKDRPGSNRIHSNGNFKTDKHGKPILLKTKEAVLKPPNVLKGKPEDNIPSILKRVDSKGGLCPKLLPNITAIRSIKTDRWLTVSSDGPVTHINTAYYDGTGGHPKVTVMAISHGHFQGAVCQMWIIDGRGNVSFHAVAALNFIVPETHGFRFAPYMFSCEVPVHWKNRVPTHISIVKDMCSSTDKVLPVNKPSKIKYNFTVCLTPINRKYQNLGEFLEFIEINGMFGADHFILYNESIGALLNPFIDMYKREDMVEIVDWKMPVKTEQGPMNEIHYFGQVIALNDCVYKARLHSKYVVAIDLDEVIVPMKLNSWSSYIEQVKKDHPGQKIGDMIFQNVFFREEWDVNPTYSKHPLVSKLKLRSLLYTKRETRTWSHRMRSKYIADPNSIVMAGIHTPWKKTPGYMEMLVPESDGLLFHYRNWENPVKEPFFEQRRMFKFKDQIIEKIEKRLSMAKSFGYLDK